MLLGAKEDLAMALEMLARDVTYPLGPYPQIREFATMLTRVKGSGQWKDREFFGYTNAAVSGAATHFYFRHCSNGIAFGFAPEAWKTLETMFAKALGLADCSRSSESWRCDMVRLRSPEGVALLRTGCWA